MMRGILSSLHRRFSTAQVSSPAPDPKTEDEMRRVIGGLLACAALAVILSPSVAQADEKEKDKGKDKLDLDKIPKKVMDSLKAKFPRANIHKWSKEKQGDDVV